MKANIVFSFIHRLGLVIYLLLNLSLACALPAQTTTPINEIDYSYNWFNDQYQPLVDDGMQFIADARKHGLEPDDYHYQTLLALSPANSINAKSRFNALLTKALLALSHDLAVGRWLPSKVDPDWHIAQPDFDAAVFLSQAMASGHLKDQLDLLAPQTDVYQQLMTSYARYQHFAMMGGWQKIPAMPKLYPGDVHDLLPLVQSRLAIEDAFFALTQAVTSDVYDPLMEKAVRRVQQRMGLKVDGVIGPKTINALNVPVEIRLAQLKINLERHRWMPRDLGARYVVINLANYQLQAFEHDQPQFTMNVIIGTKERPTPSFSAEMTHLVFNPFWNVPRRLARLDLLPKQQHDPDYFSKQTIRLFTKTGPDKIELDPAEIDWYRLDNNAALPFVLRQDPGKHNSLGQLKFMFKNPWQIYLHDSPHKSLFNQPARAYSSGCIRVADPVSLANFSLLGHQAHDTVIERIESERNQGVVLKQPLNIFVAYFTVSFQDNDVFFLQDVYLRDERMMKRLY